jgi:hypothetical protein
VVATSHAVAGEAQRAAGSQPQRAQLALLLGGRCWGRVSGRLHSLHGKAGRSFRGAGSKFLNSGSKNEAAAPSIINVRLSCNNSIKRRDPAQGHTLEQNRRRLGATPKRGGRALHSRRLRFQQPARRARARRRGPPRQERPVHLLRRPTGTARRVGSVHSTRSVRAAWQATHIRTAVRHLWHRAARHKATKQCSTGHPEGRLSARSKPAAAPATAGHRAAPTLAKYLSPNTTSCPTPTSTCA